MLVRDKLSAFMHELKVEAGSAKAKQLERPFDTRLSNLLLTNLGAGYFRGGE